MVPLTESLYVEGFVHEKDRILVDIGTGYYAEVRMQNHVRSTKSLLVGQSSDRAVLCREAVSRP